MSNINEVGDDAGLPENNPSGEPQASLKPKPSRTKRFAIAALIISVVAFLIGWIPVLGLLVGGVGIALAVIMLVKRQSKGFAITSIVLASLAFLTSTATTIAAATTSPSEASSEIAESADSEVTPAPEPTTEAKEAKEAKAEAEAEAKAEATAAAEAEAEAAAAGPDLATFGEVDERTFALMGKDPDAHVGENLVVYGNVFQFDSFTGTCSFMANTSNAAQAASYDYAQNTLVWAGDRDADCPILAPIVQGDHVKLWVTVQGSYSYETQIGGSTNALMIEAHQVELLPATEY